MVLIAITLDEWVINMTLGKPKYRNLQQGNGGGTPVLKAIWDKFDFSLLLTQSGIVKRNGVPTWLIAFAYVVGLIANKNSVSRISDYATKDSLLQPMFRNLKMAHIPLAAFLQLIIIGVYLVLKEYKDYNKKKKLHLLKEMLLYLMIQRWLMPMERKSLSFVGYMIAPLK
ncbi:hypothetical protein HZR23_10350 [Serpentinicella alkaliphila]|uniref:hypothetical protein n=1 Tax=Serpentinicella alkaliphila TaxID=1734049 RepID=UPI001BC8370C|nr:hypothetical protein [Serpentinicella alkaliphila]QUH26096.1 hypothetical protein HZR23_10350 [Serpentinicella alkaliphila]